MTNSPPTDPAVTPRFADIATFLRSRDLPVTGYRHDRDLEGIFSDRQMSYCNYGAINRSYDLDNLQTNMFVVLKGRMMKSFIYAALLSMAFFPATYAAELADIVYINGKVYTVNEAQPWATANLR